MGAGFIETVTLGLTLKLILALGEFGLDPKEWNIAGGDYAEQVLLVNANDPEFRLLGHIKEGRWSSLQVLSI